MPLAVVARAAALAATLVLAAACSPGTHRVPPPPTPSASAPPATLAPFVGDLAFRTTYAVRLLGRDGTLRDLATLDRGEVVPRLVWSTDGRYVAWLVAREGPPAIAVYDVSTDRSGAWSGRADGFYTTSLGATGDGFVAVDEDSGERLALFDPAAVVEGKGPRYVALSGTPRTDARVHLLATTRDRILVASAEDPSGAGGPDTVYDVRPDGHATRLFTDAPTRNLPMSAAALTADGRRLVYQTGTVGEECQYGFAVVVRDLATGREVRAIRSPRITGAEPVPVSVETGPDGRTYATLTNETGGCPAPPASAVFVLAGNVWRTVRTHALWAGRAADGRLAVVSAGGALTVDGTLVARGVQGAIWAPRPG